MMTKKQTSAASSQKTKTSPNPKEWKNTKFTTKEKLIREIAWQHLVDEGKVLIHHPEKPSTAQYVRELCNAMSRQDATLKAHL